MNQELRDVIFSGIVSVRDRLLKLDNPLRLESGEPSFETPEHIKEAMVKALRDNKTHYAPSTGIMELKESILRKLASKNEIVGLEPKHILVTNGGMHGLYVAFQTILNKGDEVIIPQPNWTATAWMIQLSGGKFVTVKLRPELQYRWNYDDVEAKITSKTKAILINSPQNPTGGVFNRDDMVALLKIAEKNDLYIIADEAYEDIIYDAEHISLGAVAQDFPKKVQDKVISCFTFSKSYAMTGWRLGYLACSSDEFAEHSKKMVLYTINGVSTPTQYGGIAALDGPQDEVYKMRDEYKLRRDLLFNGIKNSELLQCDTPPGGAFYLYARITDEWKESAWELVNHFIDKYSMGSVPGDIFYDNEKAIRFSYACSTEMIENAISNLTSSLTPA